MSTSGEHGDGSEQALREAAARVMARDYPGALDLLGEHVAQWPDHIAGLACHASLLAVVGRTEEALAALDRAIALSPLDVTVSVLRAHLLGNLGRHQQALEEFERALSITPVLADARSGKVAALMALHRDREALVELDRILAVEPDRLHAVRDRAIALYRLRRYEEVLPGIGRVLAVDPADISALVVAGSAAGQLGHHQEAIALLDRALAIDPYNVDALVGRSVALGRLQRLPEAMAGLDAAASIAPEHVEALNARGATLALSNHLEEALACCDRSLALRPGQLHVRSDRALVLLAMGHYAEGFREFEVRWDIPPLDSLRLQTPAPLWRSGDDPRDRTILLYHEQGFGDSIQFARWVPLVAARGAKVILRMPQALNSLMSTLKGVSQLISESEPLPPHDFHCPLMSLPVLLGATLDTIPTDIPYLRPPAQRAAQWRAELAPWTRPRIGIVWAGKPNSQVADRRDVPLEALMPLLSAAAALDVQLISLQKEVPAGDRVTLEGIARTMRPSLLLDDFADTAALIENLDLVLSVDTAVAHLAGALGKPVWIMNRHAACWRWLRRRQDSPWYPTARLFRQSVTGDWGGVVDEVGRALNNFVADWRRP